MSGFIEWLGNLNEKNTGVKAVLRRSLAFDPGQFVHAYPYVEPFVKQEGNTWRREMHYLVAGLWAMHWREDQPGDPVPIGEACAVFDSAKRKAVGTDDQQLTSTEKRFITLLDADGDQLPHRLRQMVALLKDQPIDFGHLLTGLLRWNDEQKRTQHAWARDFYKNLNRESESELTSPEENAA
jgi:CRISPR system Cascade subunit CasB